MDAASRISDKRDAEDFLLLVNCNRDFCQRCVPFRETMSLGRTKLKSETCIKKQNKTISYIFVGTSLNFQILFVLSIDDRKFHWRTGGYARCVCAVTNDRKFFNVE